MVNLNKNGNKVDKSEFNLIFSERLRIFRKKVFSIPFFTMLGVWILVYYQVSSHYHTGIGKTYQFIRGYVSSEATILQVYDTVKVRVVR